MTLFTGLSACPEKLLLVLCARREPPPEIESQIREILAQRLDWDYVLEEATENSVMPLLERSLRTLGGGLVPSAAREKLTAACRANTVRCLLLSAELAKIMAAFRGQGISAIPYKGPALAVQAYGDVALRDFDDLDVILRQKDMQKADAVMRELGFGPKFDWLLSSGDSRWMAPGEYKYLDQARRVVVELHTELTLRHFPVAPNLEELAKRAVSVQLAGKDIPTFSVEDGLPILCVHGGKDFWERIGWVADIAEMVKSHPQLDWERALRSAETFRAGRMLNLGLLLAADTLDAPVPAEIMRRVRQDEEAAKVATDLERRLLNRAEPPMTAAEIFRFRRQMVQGRMAGWSYALRLSLLPAEEDLNTLRLPKLVAPLYFAVRPLRLLRKYGARSPETRLPSS
jgi:hypothetical protein